MAGPALGTRRLFGAPGVPRFRAVTILPGASSPLPCRRNRISGFPFSQRTLARRVTVVPEEGAEVRSARTRFAPVSPRPLATMCRHLPPPKPPLVCQKDRSWVPCGYHPLKPPSKFELAIRFAPPAAKTSTLSTRHSPAPCRKIWNESAALLPLSSTPVYSMLVHALLLVSSLSAQFAASRWLLCGSINSRLLPPPSAHLPHRPPPR